MIETGYKPEGALGALYQGYNAGAAEEEQRNQMLQSYLANIKSEQDMALSRAKMPNEISISDLAGAQARSQNTAPMLEAFTRGKTGEYGQHEAKGRVALGIADTDITAGNVKNQSEIFNKKTSDFLKGADMFMGAGGNPFAMSASGMPPELIQQYSQLQKEGKLSSVVDQMKKQLVDSVEQSQKIQTEDVKGKWDIAKTNAATAGQKSIEQMRIDAGKYAKANSDKITIFTSKLKPEVQLAQINASLVNGKDPVSGEQLDEAGKNFWTMYGQSLGASAELKVRPQNAIDIGSASGMPTVATPQAIVPGGQQPTQGALPPGVTIKSK